MRRQNINKVIYLNLILLIVVAAVTLFIWQMDDSVIDIPAPDQSASKAPKTAGQDPLPIIDLDGRTGNEPSTVSLEHNSPIPEPVIEEPNTEPSVEITSGPKPMAITDGEHPKTITVSGKVFGSEWQSLFKAYVMIEIYQDGQGENPIYGTTHTGSDGSYNIEVKISKSTKVEGLNAKIAAFGHRSGHLPFQSEPFQVSIDESYYIDFGLIVGGSISGRLVDTSGAPVGKHKMVFVDSDGRDQCDFTTDSNGYFTTDTVLTTGKYHLNYVKRMPLKQTHLPKNQGLKWQVVTGQETDASSIVLAARTGMQVLIKGRDWDG